MEQLGIFDIDSDTRFNEWALETYHFQRTEVPVYRDFVTSLARKEPTHYSEIPFLPISFFKTHNIIRPGSRADLTFLSSGTTGQVRSKHLVESAQLYRDSFEKAYRMMLGDPEQQVILALLPNYLEQGHSSLVYMVDCLIKLSNNGLSGFVLNRPEEVKLRYDEALLAKKEVIVFGVSYALLDLAEHGVNLHEARIIETGGMKGRRKELTKEALHEQLCTGLGVSYISSEYGMTELLSQGYSDRNGLFNCPPWMRILIRDVNDPFGYVQNGKTGGISVIDLANRYSCSFIATQDLGRIENGQFRIMGRFDQSEVRGCNLMVP